MIINNSEYISKIKEIFADKNMYEIIKRYPTKKMHQRLLKTLKITLNLVKLEIGRKLSVVLNLRVNLNVTL